MVPDETPRVNTERIVTNPADQDPPRFLSEEAYRSLLIQLHRWGAVSRVGLTSTWRGDVRWARNQIQMSSDWRDVGVTITQGGVITTVNQLDERSLRGSIRWAEDVRQQFDGGALPQHDIVTTFGTAKFPATHIWSQSTYDQTHDTRLALAEALIEKTSTMGMLSAGYLSVDAQGYVLELIDGRIEYAPMTDAQCSLTVRDPAGSASGWAGRSSYDWNRIDAEKLAEVALDKCLRSRNPVLIEPGRYTTILEPQATFDLLKVMFDYPLPGLLYNFLLLDDNLSPHSDKKTSLPFHDERVTKVSVSQYEHDAEIYGTKIGQRVFDERITIHWDPLDPDLGRVPFVPGSNGQVYPVQPVTWVKNGVLTALGYAPGKLAINGYGDRVDINGVAWNMSSFRMDGGTTSVDEMIATTSRGLLVTRLSNLTVVWNPSMLLTGMTRDGLWLIEDGKIKQPVRNLLFTESPLYAFNQVEQIGASVPIFSPGFPAMTPPVKVRDFNFTAMADAI